jgi:hypothetical protein
VNSNERLERGRAINPPGVIKQARKRMSEKSIVISLTQPGEGDIVGQLVHALICEVGRAGSVPSTLEEFKRVATGLQAVGDIAWKTSGTFVLRVLVRLKACLLPIESAYAAPSPP